MLSEAEGTRGSSEAEWATVGPFLAATRPFVVRTNRSEFAAQVEADLRDLRCDAAASEPVVITAERQPQSWLLSPWTVEREGASPSPAVPDETVRVQLVAEVDRLALTGGARGWLPIRAAAVARDGQAFVLAGGHRTGKTMLATRLVQQGWQYLADAITFLDVEGSLDVQPYWRPFTRGPGDADASEGVAIVTGVVPASAFGRLAEATSLAAIVIARPFDEAGPIARIEPAAAIGPLSSHLGLVPDGRAVFRRLVSVVSSIPSWTMSFTDENSIAAFADISGRAS